MNKIDRLLKTAVDLAKQAAILYGFNENLKHNETYLLKLQYIIVHF